MQKTPVKKNVRARVWTMIVYPESAPKDWKELLDKTHIQWCCILHDKDVNPDGTKKKAHYHVVLIFEGKKSFNQIKELTDKLNAPVPQKVASLKGMVRYLIHKDNPEKYQYPEENIEAHGGFDYEPYLQMSSGSQREVMKEITKYVYKNSIISYADLVMDAINTDDDWFDAVSQHTIYFGRLVDDIYKKGKRIKEEEAELEVKAEKDPTSLTPQERAKVMAKKGIKQKEIADTLGVNKSTVSRWLKK